MRHVPAPNIAAFAEEAVVFENAHAAAPLCSPARGALFTEIAPYRNGELYNRRTDPVELVNVIDDPRYHEIRQRYAQLLHDWLERCGDPIEHSSIAPAPPRSRHSDDLEPIDSASQG